MDLEKKHDDWKEDNVTTLAFSSVPSLELFDVSRTTFPSQSSLEPQLKRFDLKPKHDIFAEKTVNSFTTYRKIFTLIFTANLVILVAFIAKAKGTPIASDIASASSANLMVAILFRQENFVNLCYEIAVSVPHSLPVSVRRRLAEVFYYGDAHSGSGTAAVAWFILYTAISTKDYIQAPNRDELAPLAMSYFLMSMFVFILGAAHPRFRAMFQDYCVVLHRFSGWISLIVFWIINGLAARNSARQERISTGFYIVRSPDFWFFCVMTICMLLSWSRLTRHIVYPEILSDYAIRLHFKYRPMQPFYNLKLSTRPFFDWHAFTTIPDEDENGNINGFSVVVTNSSIWTKGTIMNPSTELWVRGYPLHDLLYTSKLFKRIVVVATGSGIGPCLSLFYANITPCRVLWSSPHPETTYGSQIMDSVLKADPNAIVWNTITLGRPDLVSLTYKLVLESDAEAVFIISNPMVTQKVINAMETKGIPAYGTIFDS